MEQSRSIRELAGEMAQAGHLVSIDPSGRKVTVQEIDQALGDLRALTEGGIHATG